MEDGYITVIKRGSPYLTRKQLMEELGYKSLASVNSLIRGIEGEIGKRYNRYAIAGKRYNFYVVVDYLKYRDDLENPMVRKYLPPFSPQEIADICGFGKEIIKVKEEAVS